MSSKTAFQCGHRNVFLSVQQWCAVCGRTAKWANTRINGGDRYFLRHGSRSCVCVSPRPVLCALGTTGSLALFAFLYRALCCACCLKIGCTGQGCRGSHRPLDHASGPAAAAAAAVRCLCRRRCRPAVPPTTSRRSRPCTAAHHGIPRRSRHKQRPWMTGMGMRTTAVAHQGGPSRSRSSHGCARTTLTSSCSCTTCDKSGMRCRTTCAKPWKRCVFVCCSSLTRARCRTPCSSSNWHRRQASCRNGPRCCNGPWRRSSSCAGYRTSTSNKCESNVFPLSPPLS